MSRFSMSPSALRAGYAVDERILGIGLAVALHVLPCAVLAYRAASRPSTSEEVVVSRPAIGATLLKLGKPIDRSKLPDRLVPQKPLAPKNDVVASANDPLKKHADAGAAPPLAEDSDLRNFAKRTDLFAEKTHRIATEEGNAKGSEIGTETDETRVHAGDMYAAEVAHFLHQRWQIPSVISQDELRRLCAAFDVNIGPTMVIWHVGEKPVKSSGNELFDDSVRAMFQTLMTTHEQLPNPPEGVAEQWKGRTVRIRFSGDLSGAGKCK